MGAVGRASVLIVEDGIIGEAIETMLQGLGYDPYATAASADEAIGVATQRRPDVVLMDIRIHGTRDGIELAAIMRDRFRVPVVFMTAQADDATIDRAKKAEPYGFLMKPLRKTELRSALEIAIYRAGLERQLRERERWFSSTLQSVTDAVVTVDLLGNVTFMNPGAEALTGIRFDDARGRPVHDVVRLLDPTQTASPLDLALAEKRTVTVEEAPLQNATNANRIISDSASPVMSDGEMLGAVMVFRDITEHKLQQKQLELTDRLASLGTMAAGVAHEVNSPLAVVIANAAFVMDELRTLQRLGPGDAKGLAEAVDAQGELDLAARRIAQIVAELQVFARPSPTTSAGADVAASVKWAVYVTASEFRPRASVVLDIEPTPRVRVDEARLGQILVHLLMNAAHAIAPGDFAHNAVTIAVRCANNNITIEVRDTGTGMAPDAVARVFEPFYRTKAVGIGPGLGLSICHGIVTSEGGRFDVESTVGKGSMFRVTLPIAAPVAIAAPVPIPAPVVTPRGRVLVVDDDHMILQALRRILRDHDVVCVDDARSALGLLEAGESFDVIFSDLMMPNMTGMVFYERLVAAHPTAARRVVFLSGGAITVSVQDFIDQVPNVTLEKPFVTNVLRELVRDALVHPAS